MRFTITYTAKGGLTEVHEFAHPLHNININENFVGFY